MRVLVVTNMYPTAASPAFGTFVHDQVESLRRAGVEIDVLSFDGRRNRLHYLLAFPRLWWRLLRRRYDLLHAHYVLAGLVARAQWGRPVVLTHHGPEVLGQPRWQGWLCRLVTPLFDEVIHVTEQVRSALNDVDGWVIPCGIDLQTFRPTPRAEARAALGLPPDRPLVLWAGNPRRPEKCFWLTEAAVDLARQTLPDLELVLLADRPHDQVPLYMSACDALILTSRLEGSPMVVKEALACDLPIVSVPVGDVPEIIAGVEPCRLAARDPVDLAARLVEVLRTGRRSEGRGRAARYDEDRIAARVLQVYRRALRAAAPVGQYAVR